MKILHIQKSDLDDTARKVLEIHKQGNTVTIVDIRKEKDYAKIVDLIFSSDKVVSW